MTGGGVVDSSKAGIAAWVLTDHQTCTRYEGKAGPGACFELGEQYMALNRPSLLIKRRLRGTTAVR
jgi:hypothetical protein